MNTPPRLSLTRSASRRAGKFCSGLAVLCLSLALTGCGDPGGTSQSAQFDLKLQRMETSPIPGATGRVLAAAPGSPTGPSTDSCVTDAGFCPVAATPAGRNCICQAGNLMYGGQTGVPPQFNTTTNP